MKILHVISTMDPKTGGVCKAVRDIIEGIRIINPEIINEVLCLDPQTADYLAEDTFFTIALGTNKTGWSYSKELLPWMKKHIKNYDLLIVHGLWQYQSFVVAQIAKSKDIPYFVMPHGMLDPYFQKAKERKLKAIRNRIFWQFIEKKLINNAKGLLFTCEEEMKLARTTFPMYNPKSEKVVGLGVKLPPVVTNKMREEFQLIVPEWNGKPFWLFLSRIHPKKGVDLLIEAYTKLEQENIDLPQLIIAGPGLNSEYGKKVLEKSKSSKNIYFPGMLTGDARWGAFYSAECFILPSHQENFGIAVVEALACGIPVLITNKVNIWREIERNKAGIVQNDDTGSIFKLLKTWFNYSYELKKYYKQNARGVFQKYFEIHQVGKRFVKELI